MKAKRPINSLKRAEQTPYIKMRTYEKRKREVLKKDISEYNVSALKRLRSTYQSLVNSA